MTYYWSEMNNHEEREMTVAVTRGDSRSDITLVTRINNEREITVAVTR